MINMIHDNKIDADNYMINISIGEYYELVKDHLNDNEYQRKRVKNSKSIYAQLKSDLESGCIMPPIVLAYGGDIDDSNSILCQLSEGKNKLIILDGLQRSYTIKEIVTSWSSGEYKYNNPLGHKIRVEIYTGINKLGILYRMLTLNTGQTQMSIRHQIEIVYSDYRKGCGVDGVTLFTEVDGRTPYELGEYRFRDVVDGFTSYLQKDYLTIDRLDILDNVKNLKRLIAGGNNNLFDSFLSSYHAFVCKMDDIIGNGYKLDFQILELNRSPFATSVVQMFNKSQPMTGYGCALASLMDLGIIKSFEEVKSNIVLIEESEARDGVITIIKYLDDLSKQAKKIGNDQRLYFYYFFKSLFDKESECFRNVDGSAENAMKQYIRETQ